MSDSKESKVTLLRRGYLLPTPGMTPYQLQDVKSAIPRDFIVQSVKLREVPSTAGDRVTVLKSATGSGKSITIPPAFLYRRKRIAVTEPSRLSVEEISLDLARRNPEILKTGENVGFQTGMIKKAPKTGIVVLTPGVLLQHFTVMTPEQIMRRYSTVIIDEVHKHDIMMDFLLLAIRDFLAKHWNNPDCPHVILMSATIDPQKYLDYYGTKHVIIVGGQPSQPITETWTKSAVADLEQTIVALIPQLPAGDTLVFLPTVRSIQSLHIKLRKMRLRVVEIYSELLERKSSDARSLQHKSQSSRIILATNAAETGVTFPHLVNVIDTGLVNYVVFNPQLGAKIIFIGAVSKASATQRRGRVGRTQPGNWYPMYTQVEYQSMIPDPHPEILTQDISMYLLKYIVMRCNVRIGDQGNQDGQDIKSDCAFDASNMRLIHPISSEMLQYCYEKLYVLGFIDSQMQITYSGWIASRFTEFDPQEIRFMLAAMYHGADTYSAVVIASCVAVARSKSLGSLPPNWTIRDEFIDALLTYEALQEKINQSHAGKDLDVTEVEKWCEDKQLNYFAWLQVLELVDETVLRILECGFMVSWGAHRIPLTSMLQTKTHVREVVALKNALVEAYRLQTCTWNSKLEGYVSDMRGMVIKSKSPILGEKPVMTFVCSSFEGRSKHKELHFVTSGYVSVLDDWVDIDKHFLY